ncbi:hypothetical protein ACF0H5_016019 [Mactra antiquata]
MLSVLMYITILYGIVFISYESYSVKAEEPKCPSSYLEERLLEKMISVEFNTQHTMERLDELQDIVSVKNHRKERKTLNAINNVLSVEDLEYNNWQLIFRATSGNGHNVYNAWTTGTGTCDTKPDTMARSKSCHYRSSIVSAWSISNIKMVKLALYTEDKEVAYIIFNGENSNSVNWFDASRVISSSWSDVTPTDSYNYFSIVGHYIAGRHDRRFFINRSYKGCNNDLGNLAVIDTLSAGKPCLFDRHPVYPQFVYSQINSVNYWQNGLFGRADYFAVFIKTS